jgi:murein L,D-transpeptidase YcbB/YkuD
VALAEWVVGEQAEWNRARILAAIDAGDTRVVAVVNPPRVVVFYMTAAFFPEDETIRFADDIYGHDARLEAWLQARTGE